MKEGLKNILLVRTDRIGDVVLTTPSIKALREAYPGAKISILVSPLTQDLVIGNPFLSEVIVDDRPKEHKGGWGFFKLVGLLKKRKFDAAIIFHTKKRTNSLCFFAGIPRRIGYKNNKFGFLLTDPIKDTRHQGLQHEAEYCLDVLKTLGIEAQGRRTFLPIQKDAEEWVQAFLDKEKISADEKIVAIHPGASCPTKMWPAKRFAELIPLLNEKYPTQIVVVGDSSLESLAREIKFLCPIPVIDLVGKTTVGQLAALLKRSCLLISNDSGPVHVADAAGTPVVSIFTRNKPGINPERWGPLSDRSRIVCTQFKGEVSFEKNAKNDPAYLESIQAKEVLEAVDSIFKLC